jgi:hypothetical protein
LIIYFGQYQAIVVAKKTAEKTRGRQYTAINGRRTGGMVDARDKPGMTTIRGAERPLLVESSC